MVLAVEAVGAAELVGAPGALVPSIPPGDVFPSSEAELQPPTAIPQQLLDPFSAAAAITLPGGAPASASAQLPPSLTSAASYPLLGSLGGRSEQRSTGGFGVFSMRHTPLPSICTYQLHVSGQIMASKLTVNCQLSAATNRHSPEDEVRQQAGGAGLADFGVYLPGGAVEAMVVTDSAKVRCVCW